MSYWGDAILHLSFRIVLVGTRDLTSFKYITFLKLWTDGILVCSNCCNKTLQNNWLTYTTEICFLSVLKADNVRLTCQHGPFLVRALFLALRGLPSYCVLTWPFLVCTSAQGHSGVSSNNTNSVGSGTHRYYLI